MWISLQPARREQEFKACPKWKKYWRAIQRKDNPEQLEKLNWERRFLHRLMVKFMSVLDTITEDGFLPDDKVDGLIKYPLLFWLGHYFTVALLRALFRAGDRFGSATPDKAVLQYGAGWLSSRCELSAFCAHQKARGSLVHTGECILDGFPRTC